MPRPSGLSRAGRGERERVRVRGGREGGRAIGRERREERDR